MGSLGPETCPCHLPSLAALVGCIRGAVSGLGSQGSTTAVPHCFSFPGHSC